MLKVKIFKQDILTIANNVIVSTNSFIQIRNITRVWHGRLDVNIPYFRIALLFLAGISIQTIDLGGLGSIGIVAILLAIAIAGYYGYLWSHYTLNFELTSGEVYAFTSLKQEFLITSYNKVKELLESKETIQNYEVNFESCEIKIVEGDNIEGHNVVVSKDSVDSPIHFQSPDNSVNIKASGNGSVGNVSTNNKNTIDSFNTTIDYKKIYADLEVIENSIKEKDDTKELEIIKTAKQSAKERNEKGLKSALSKLSKPTMDFITTASGLVTIAEFIKNFINI